jgi:hypothetical protein
MSAFGGHCEAGGGTTALYAVIYDSPVYHLLESQADQTLCGLEISRVIPYPRPGDPPLLHLVHHKPLDKSLCESCAQLTRLAFQYGK